MCAEAVPWRCHRSLVADVLSVRGADVLHIIGESAPRPHRLTAFARAASGKVSYPAAEDDSLQLQTAPPFHLAATIRVLQRRPVNPVDVWEGECWRRALTTADGIMLAEVHNRGSIDAPDVHGCVRSGNPSAATRVALGATLRRVLGLDVQPAPLQAVAARERHLRSIAAALRGMRPPRFADLFETVINVFPFQQLSLDAGVAILTRLVHRFGESIVHDDRTYYAFPTADAIAGARLPALLTCGLSRSKAESLRRVARAVRAGTLSEHTIDQLSTPDALRALVELPGVGPWSAAVILLRGFGRLDVFPPGDVGAARDLSALLHVRSAASLSRVIERFGDYRGYLYFYGIGASLLEKGVIPAAPAADS
jgi:DNA-3-methyladenine glycosylase II